MNELPEERRAEARQMPAAPEKTGMSKVWKAIVIVLAVIGALALIALFGMFWMHDSMMGGMGMGQGMGMGRR